MSDSPAARLAARKASRPMPPLIVAREGQPAVAVGAKRSPKRPRTINTPVSERTYKLLEELTHHFRKSNGPGWRMNTTIEHALDTLAREISGETTNGA